ncbi:squalene/phytoene synthase family protein [Lysinibacter sp. HNR]|uniref:phytoene/squalene synthase family protein n=1 Tax=Lysinibacter sp. HNR TaxID=3031408 RepID=UPI002435F1F2|nr:squalene/phytoene synthase family protein [Lysinibacter sp. HNR]WGD36409.1 squalene/phytoene synthase family protein [Lysinibacter sp. HNR]
MTSNDSALHQFTRTAELAADEVITAYSTSFGLATKLLGRRHRQHVRNIYALVRIADEIVDGVASEAGLGVPEQQRVLDRYVEDTYCAMRTGYSCDLVIHAFASTARAASIDEALVRPFFESMYQDLSGDLHAPLVFDEQAHSRYIYGSAEVVGLMCLRVFVRDRRLDESQWQQLEYGARQLGAAFQNINFLRDLADDTDRLGRSYLSKNPHLTDEDRLLWVRTVRSQLKNARATIALLPKDSRAAVRSALALFSALTDRVERTPVEELYRSRVRVPDLLKAALAARALLTTWLERDS